MDLDIRIQPEMITQQVIQLQAELVILYRRGDSEQTRFFKEIVVQFFYV